MNIATIFRALTLSLAAALIPASLTAAQISFDAGWREQRFAMFSSNGYGPRGSTLDIVSDGTVSLLWTRLPESLWPARSASWVWSVQDSVPPTDLRRKGGDDRNLALYFVFLPAETARANADSGIRRLLDADEARVLVYVWGGASGQPRVQTSPYLGPRGRTVALRPAGTGQATEKIDLAADFRAAFGEAPTALVGLAVSADSDDTNTRIRARISDLTLR